MSTAPNIIISENRDLVREALRIPSELCDREANRLIDIWGDALISRLRWAGFRVPSEIVRFDSESVVWDLEEYPDYERRSIVIWRGVDSSLINRIIDEARAEVEAAIIELACRIVSSRR